MTSWQPWQESLGQTGEEKGEREGDSGVSSEGYKEVCSDVKQTFTSKEESPHLP